MPDAIGWLSSLILLSTIAKQIHKQWREESKGVSIWLFVGQSVASAGFTVYSLLLKSWVFVVTNSLLFLAGLTGLVITWLHQRARRSRAGTSETGQADSFA